MTDQAIDKAYAFKKIDTGSLHDLVRSSSKIDGTFWSYVDSSTDFLETAFFSTIRLMKDLALTALSLVGILFEGGRALFVSSLCRSVIDLTAIGIGLIGIVNQDMAKNLTARVLELLNKYVLDYQILEEKTLKENTVTSNIWLGAYLQDRGSLTIGDDEPKPINTPVPVKA